TVSGDIVVEGDIDFSSADVIDLASDVAMTSVSGNIDLFGSVISAAEAIGAHTLTLNAVAGAVDMGEIGFLTPLTALYVNSGGTITAHDDITTTGEVRLSADVAIFVDGAVDGSGIILDAGQDGDVEVNAALFAHDAISINGSNI